MDMFRLAPLCILLAAQPLAAAVQRVKFTSERGYLIVETLRDDVLHVELAAGTGPGDTTPVYASPMVWKRDYPGASFYTQNGSVLETGAIRAGINSQTLCISITDKTRNAGLTTVCPMELGQDWKGLTLAKGQMENVYGLGQQFKQLGLADGDWVAHRIRDSGPNGNVFAGFAPGGMVGNVQFPILYAVGGNNLNYALLLDNVYKQTWDFTGDPWKVQMFGDQIRFYVMTGPDLPDLRKDYLELAGRPPVPPRKAFGLWVSEFGYKNWDRVDTLRSGLRRDGFPVDGFVLDLQWFGGVRQGDPNSPMGRLDWDLGAFPDPDTNIARLAGDQIGLVTIEESYISGNLDTFSQMKAAGKFLAYAPTDSRCDPSSYTPILLSDWFGKAGMVDWSNPEAGLWVHENRRLPNLMRKGILGHWTDLGEPEKYNGNACYQGVEMTGSGPKNRHADVHNLYAFLWTQSIYDGYYRNRDSVKRRPFILSRSGAPGVQRSGVAMWSGDIGSNLDLLATHSNAQMHMSFSGIDYYGSDVGGFRREVMPCNEGHSGNLQYQNELYTQWFANAAWFDVPVRPHTDNTFQSTASYETAPDLVGDVKSNHENLKQRYELLPYYYSLAHRAFFYGEPVVPPPVFYYQNDAAVRQIGHQKLIGKDLMVALVARHGEYARDLYLPAGQWVNYHTNEWFDSAGMWVRGFPTYIDGVFRLPAFARGGAIIPMMQVDEQTKDSFGHRKDGSSRQELIVKVYAGERPTAFTLYEDDGASLEYDSSQRPVYKVRTTVLSQQTTGQVVTVTIYKAEGGYDGASAQRDNIVRLAVQDALGAGVSLDGVALPRWDSQAAFEAAPSGWYNAGGNLIVAKSGVRGVDAKKTFRFAIQPIAPATSVHLACDNGWTQPGEAVYAVGSRTELGNWDASRAVKLEPNVYFEYIYLESAEI